MDGDTLPVQWVMCRDMSIDLVHSRLLRVDSLLHTGHITILLYDSLLLLSL